uniref:Uncharacterized protein n=1 Tax=Arundo donax TaxID=35708 RepID=A0A0A9GU97_ARUDO
MSSHLTISVVETCSELNSQICLISMQNWIIN